MNDIVKNTLDKLRQCDDFHNRCDCLLEHSEITYLLDYIKDQQEEIERLNKKILTLEETIRKANNNVIKDIAMIKTHEMVKQEIVQRLIETSKILENGSDKE